MNLTPQGLSEMVDPVQIRLDLREPASQTIQVEMRWMPICHRQTWQLPVWTPGSYTVRDHVQHLHSLILSSGSGPLPTRRLAPNRWQCDLPELTPLSIRYSIEARDLTVRTGLLDPDFASLSLAAVMLELEGFRWTDHLIVVEAPEQWEVHLPLQKQGDGWIASNFDELVDSPLHAGPFGSQCFDVLGHRHELLLIGAPPFGWPDNFLADVEAICSATCQLMGTPPPAGDRYQLVIQLLDKGYGGLEHDHSSVLQFSWNALKDAKGYRQLLQLIGHEYLHQWNVRRLRPAEYRPYDYGRAVVSEGLWFAEGITSYYDLFLPLLAGCSDRATLIADLGDELSSVLMTPGRAIQSLSASAEEAWVKLYKATPSSRDSQVSYYRLGTAVAFCLDVRLRRRSSSLAELLRQLWTSHGCCGRGYRREDLITLIAAVEPDLGTDLNQWLDQPDFLPLVATAQLIGLRLDPVPSSTPHHGLTVSETDGGVWIRRVERHSPGLSAGLVVGDELIAVDGTRLRSSSDLPLLLRNKELVTVLFCRRGRLQETRLSPDTGLDRWQLDWDPAAKTAHKELRDQWFEIL